MKSSLASLGCYKDTIRKVSELLASGYSIEDILKYIDITDNYLIELLVEYEFQTPEVLNKIKEHYNKYKIDTDRVLVISDNHIGSYDEDLLLYKLAYEYAYKNNIKDVIHLGDIIQGNTDTNKVKDDFEKQIEKLKKFYSNVKDINTYYLQGNHEYNLLFYDNINILDYISDISNLHYLGYQNSYISLKYDDQIRLFHFIKSIRNYKTQKANVPDIKTNLVLEGHHHKYNRDGNILSVPALSKGSSSNDRVGFIDLYDDYFEYVSKHIGFDGRYSYDKKEEEIFKKSI